jgi:hypothetical protein
MAHLSGLLKTELVFCSLATEADDASMHPAVDDQETVFREAADPVLSTHIFLRTATKLLIVLSKLKVIDTNAK